MIKIPPQYKLLAQIIFLGLVFLCGFLVRGYMAGRDELAAQVASQAAENKRLGEYTQKFEALTTRFNQVQSKLHAIDTNHSEVLNAKLEENSALRGDLAVARGMRLKGTVCPRLPAATADTPASSVGDAAGIELSEETRQAVFDLRGDLIRDREKIEYLHAYLRQIGLAPPAE